MNARHPAKFTDSIIDVLQKELRPYRMILDPFGGVGKLHQVKIRGKIICGEIEYEWARQGSDLVHDALHLPFANETFDCICTSPTYGNRMADHHHAKDASRRTSYTHCLGHSLHPHNSGQMQWGEAYREFHRQVWKECDRVLKKFGVIYLNASNHIRKGQEIEVVAFHDEVLRDLGFVCGWSEQVQTPRHRFGANSDLRVSYEVVIQYVRRA